MTEKPLHQLEQLRRTRDWSYQDLADEIREATGFQRDHDTWRRICQHETLSPNACTRFALDKFFTHLEAQDRLAKKQRRAS